MDRDSASQRAKLIIEANRVRDRHYDVRLSSIKHFRHRSFYRRRIFLARHNCSINRIAGRRELFYHLSSYSPTKNLHSSRGNGDVFCRNEMKERTGQEWEREGEKELLDTSWWTIAMSFIAAVVKIGTRIRKKKNGQDRAGGGKAGMKGSPGTRIPHSCDTCRNYPDDS